LFNQNISKVIQIHQITTDISEVVKVLANAAATAKLIQLISYSCFSLSLFKDIF